MSEPEAVQPRIALLGIPIEIGASQPGTLMGPDALRTAGIGRILGQLGFAVEDHGNMAPSGIAPAEGPPPANAKFYDEIKGWIRALSERSFLLARSGAVADLHGRRSLAVDGIGERRRALLAGAGPAAVRAVARCPCRLQHAADDGDRQHARHVGGVSVRRTRSRRAARQASPAPRSAPTGSICSASARSIRWRRSWCSSAASRSPTCARSTNSASAC